jgi:hypothetical protein
MRGDIFALGGHFFLGIFMIFFFESIVYQTCWIRLMYCICCCCFKTQKKRGQGQEIEDAITHMDEDVLAEEKRVLEMDPSEL